MNALASEVAGAPQSLHRGENELPFVPYQEGVLFQLLQVNTETGLWVIRVRFQPGVTIQRHRHTGEVFAFTLSGSWRYLEDPDINVAGSYLFEPSGAIHTLTMALGDESERVALAMALGLPLPEEIFARERAAREEGERIGAARERRACWDLAFVPGHALAELIAHAIAARGPMEPEVERG